MAKKKRVKHTSGRCASGNDKSSKVRKLIKLARAGKLRKKKLRAGSKKSKKKKRK